jgi:hypothetical protein
MIRSVCFRVLSALFLVSVALGLTSCSQRYYKFPEYNFAGRPVPPSKLAERVMVSYTVNGSSGGLEIMDALRDIRNNVENTIRFFGISGYSGGYPQTIYSFPEQLRGYVYSTSDNSLTTVSYSSESALGAAANLPGPTTSIGIPTTFASFYASGEQANTLVVYDNLLASTYALNLPNVYRVATNPGNSVALAMVRNSNTLYRILKLNPNQGTPVGAVECQPVTVPVYCVVPVPGNYDRPIGAYFSTDGTSVYILNCGPECGGTTASVSILQTAPLNENIIPTSLPYPSPVTGNVVVPGGVTDALSNGTTLYVSGQQLQGDGLFAGNLSTINLSTLQVTGKYAISDGTHTKMLFADDNTLWIGSQQCASGERFKQGLNYNCLTRFDTGALTASIVPAVNPNDASQVPYPNADNNLKYYGSLTGLCWVQTFHKVYTAYGGQVHLFNTATGAEIDNTNVTVQGTALDVAYLDAQTNFDD